MRTDKRVVIIGAGPGGLTAGMILARRGFDVTIVEKKDRVGGRNAELRAGDFSFDTGPTFLHQKFTLDEVFAEAGRKSEDYLDFLLLDTMARLSWGDTSLETTSDVEKMAQRIGQAFPGNAEGHRRFMDPHDPEWEMKAENRDRPLNAYHKAFTQTQVLLRYPTGTTNPDLKARFGYHDDSFAYETLRPEWGFLPRLKENGLLEIWKQKPIGGEIRPELQPTIFDTWPNLSVREGSRAIENLSECIETTHASWMLNDDLEMQRIFGPFVG